MKTDRRAALESAWAKQQEHIKATEEYIRRYKAGIKSKQARGRQKVLGPGAVDAGHRNALPQRDAFDVLVDSSSFIRPCWVAVFKSVIPALIEVRVSKKERLTSP